MTPKNERELRIMQIIHSSSAPIGAAYLSKEMGIPIATVGRLLAKLENEDKLEKVANRGRQLTPTGKMLLSTLMNRSVKIKAANKLVKLVEDNSRERLLEVLLVRKLLETKAVEIATQKATKQDIQVLEDILADYTYEIKHGLSDVETDVRLHLSIAKISGNVTVLHILELLMRDDNTHILITQAAGQPDADRLAQHRNIIAGIKSGDPARATGAMANHLDSLIANVSA